jgi:hypothetical protein
VILDRSAPVTETESEQLNGAATREPSPESPPELNGNGGLAREQGMQRQADISQERDRHAAAADFAAIIEPLEVRAGKRLNGPGLRRCRAAYDENPDGFRLVAHDALERAVVNPLGLLVRMVRDGDHLLEPPPYPADGLTIRDERAVEEMLAEKRLPPLFCASCRRPREVGAWSKCLCGRPWSESKAAVA